MKICVFAASAAQLPEPYLRAAEEAGRLLAAGGHSLIYGAGASGLMGACARAAAGAEIIGISPRWFDEPGVLNHDCSRLILTDTMRERKALMEELAEGFLVLPGGIGTFEEFFETLTLSSLGRLKKPIVLLNTGGYYEPLLALLKEGAREGFLASGVLELFRLADTPREALAHLTGDFS